MGSSPEDQLATMIANIPEKTGKPLPEWIAIIEKSGLEKHGAILKLLKDEHGVTHGFANLIAAKARETGEDVDPVAAQYSGLKRRCAPFTKTLSSLLGRSAAMSKSLPRRPTSVCAERAICFGHRSYQDPH